MMKIKKTALFGIVMLFSIMTCTAQDKLFTLEELNFGGKNYRSLLPQNMWLTWWGDQLMYQDAEEGGTIDPKTGKKQRCFTLEQVNQLLPAEVNGKKLHSAFSASYPYPEKPLVLLTSSSFQLLYHFKDKKIAWLQMKDQADVTEWNKTSKALAYVKDHQLWICDAQGENAQLTTDGSREIVYGQAVHRNEFGITGGLFWSPDGQRLAFYRMDQSVLPTNPINIRWQERPVIR